VGGGFVLILLGSIGLYIFIKKSFVEAARLFKSKGIPLPDTFKGLDERIEKLKREFDSGKGSD
jgi:hypothetical protein